MTTQQVLTMLKKHLIEDDVDYHHFLQHARRAFKTLGLGWDKVNK
jgi:hypothetical protein